MCDGWAASSRGRELDRSGLPFAGSALSGAGGGGCRRGGRRSDVVQDALRSLQAGHLA